MAKEKKLVVGAVNITIQPHTPEKYIELFKDVYKLKSSVQISGDQYGLIANLMKLEKDQKEPGAITGDIFKYTNINKSAQWFNTETNDFASDDDVGGINIPDNLKPNSSRFSYIFFPKEHLLFYEGYYDGNSFGPTNAERFIDRILNQDSIIEKYGKIDVTHVPAVDKLSDALKMKVKERIEMVVKRPNPDNHAEAEQRVMRRMRAQKVEVYEQKYKAVPNESIEIDEDIETMAHIAAKNGSFFIKGKDLNFKPIEFSTIKHPFKSLNIMIPM